MWYWLGEPLAADVANTLRRRGYERTDELTGPEAMRSWLDAEREIDPDRIPSLTARQARECFEEFRGLRDDVSALLAGTLRGKLPDGPRRRLNALAARLPVVVSLGVDGTPRRTVPAATDRGEALLGFVAAATVDQVASPEWLGFCDAPSCGMYFRPARLNARWCSPACGTRYRVAQHARRHR